jgi:hypothetical protein
MRKLIMKKLIRSSKIIIIRNYGKCTKPLPVLSKKREIRVLYPSPAKHASSSIFP